MRIAVGIITLGRAAILRETLKDVLGQTRPAERVIVCAARAEDAAGLPAGAEVMFAGEGTSPQRNRIIEAAADCDLVVFLDDDFLPEPRYLAATEAAFAADPGLAVSTGTVIADGAKGPGIGLDAARALLAALPPPPDAAPAPAYNGYGCNMAVRLETVRAHAIRFDERLRHYGWYEDLDFSRRVGAHGRIRRLADARGVHMGAKSGRGPGLRLGYAQVINPIYIARGGAYHWNRALRSVGRHILMNLLRSPWPEPWIDRRGRLKGNLLALADVLRGRIDPARVSGL
jgi:GT2 family glycosyltransferase